MRISFDLDDTLICLDPAVPREPNRVPRLLKFYFNDPLRAGTIALFQQLREEGWEIFIYTSSLRSQAYIRWLFWFYGLKIDKVINQNIHDATVKDGPYKAGPSKLPGKFGIKLHVDDADYVYETGRQFGFDVLLIKPEDNQWTAKVLSEAKRYKENRK